MLTFLAMALALIGFAVLLDQVLLRTRVIFTRRVLSVAAYLVVTTLVFDNLLSALPVYVFDRAKTLGVYLPWAPLEDLFYIVGVVFFVATVDAFLRRALPAERRPQPQERRRPR
jgi:lycopene cyclase domain-containing protein